MTIFVCWFVFPAVLALISLGCGLLLERTTRIRLPAELLMPVGFAVIVVVSLFATLSATTSRFALPSVLALGAVGLAAAVPPSVRRVDPWAAAAAVGVFAVFAAPVALSGDATFAGYVKLDDTATFLAITDRALEHGRSLEGLGPSSYEAALAFNLPFYPLGSLLPLGIGATLVGQDAAWVFQPYLAFLAALLALSLYRIATLVVESRAACGAAAFVSSQAALLYGYAFWGGIKEVASAALVALSAAVAGAAFGARRSVWALLPLLVSAGALVGVLSIGAAAWLLPILAVVGISLLRRRAKLRPALLLGVGAALFVPSLAVAGVMFREGVLSSVRDEAELGNLVAPLSPLQIFGIWPAGDFRLEPDRMDMTLILVAVVLLAGAFALTISIVRRAWELPLYVLGVAGATIAYAWLGSPWIEAKAFAIAAPALLLAATTGALALLPTRRVESAVVIGAIALGVGWSNALAYGDVTLAPREQLAELEAIGERFAGQGPALMTEYQPYGVRHFLRNAQAEGASELRRRLVPLRDGSSLPKGGYADLDAFDVASVLAYRTLVLRRSPVASRPPTQYRLVWSRRFYEVWQRPDHAARIVRHEPLGDSKLSASARPLCADVARLARRGGVLAAPKGNQPLVFGLGELSRTQSSAAADWVVTIPTAGRWELWLGGSFRGRITVRLDGAEVASIRHHLNNAGQYTPLAAVELAAGRHRLHFAYQTGRLHPGGTGAQWVMGPLMLSPVRPHRVSYIGREDAERLCSTRIDWIEVLPVSAS